MERVVSKKKTVAIMTANSLKITNTKQVNIMMLLRRKNTCRCTTKGIRLVADKLLKYQIFRSKIKSVYQICFGYLLEVPKI